MNALPLTPEEMPYYRALCDPVVFHREATSAMWCRLFATLDAERERSARLLAEAWDGSVLVA